MSAMMSNNKRSRNYRTRFNCDDCGVDTSSRARFGDWYMAGIGEFYRVKHHIWQEAQRGDREPKFLCIGCLENRLGHTLTINDFTDAPINNPGVFAMSPRLRDRLSRRSWWPVGPQWEARLAALRSGLN